jgi:hypothetical protein
MICHYCGRSCTSRLEGRRVGLHGRALFLCHNCPPPDPVRTDQGVRCLPDGPPSADDGGEGAGEE